MVNWAALYLVENTAAVEATCLPALQVELRISWSPPPAKLFNVNDDRAAFAQSVVGIGVIIRDDSGRVEAALSKKIYALLGAVEAKAKAFEVGLLFAKDIGI